MVIDYIDAHKGVYGVEPICRVLTEHGTPIAPWTYYEARSRARSRRAGRDEHLRAEVARVHQANYGVYGARKVWMQLNREDVDVARCTVERLMRQLGPRGSAPGGEETHHHRRSPGRPRW